MSKIITKKQLNLVIENTLKEVGLTMEGTCPECGGMIKEGLCEAGCGTDYMEEELHGKQKKLDKNKNNKIDSEDFKMLRGEKDEVEESIDNLAESLSKKNNNKLLVEETNNFNRLINYKF
jgi:methionyl-tRNA synthetase